VGYVEQNLITGEEIRYKTGRHWITLFWPGLFGLVLGLCGLFWLFVAIASISDKDASAGPTAKLGAASLVLGALLIGYGILKKNTVEMAVTNKRVIVKYGLVSRKTFELLLSKVESIGVDEGLIGRILGYGTVVVRGTGGTPEPFKRIGHPLEFRRQVQQQIEVYQGQGKVTT
jgi:uncharacterized membrane protein YdbT with pleckstrin-like domain